MNMNCSQRDIPWWGAICMSDASHMQMAPHRGFLHSRQAGRLQRGGRDCFIDCI